MVENWHPRDAADLAQCHAAFIAMIVLFFIMRLTKAQLEFSGKLEILPVSRHFQHCSALCIDHLE